VLLLKVVVGAGGPSLQDDMKLNIPTVLRQSLCNGDCFVGRRKRHVDLNRVVVVTQGVAILKRERDSGF